MQDEQFFPAFKKSQNYIKLLAELDLLKEGNTKAEEDSKKNSFFLIFLCFMCLLRHSFLSVLNAKHFYKLDFFSKLFLYLM